MLQPPSLPRIVGLQRVCLACEQLFCDWLWEMAQGDVSIIRDVSPSARTGTGSQVAVEIPNAPEGDLRVVSCHYLRGLEVLHRASVVM